MSERFKEIIIFLREQGSPLSRVFEQDGFLLRQAYLADIFEKINSLNKSLQGGSISVIESREKLEALLQKVEIWKTRIHNGQFESFAQLANMTHIDGNLKHQISEHLPTLQQPFDKYFSGGENVSETDMWVRNPFLFDFSAMDDAASWKEDFIELKNGEFRMKFNNRTDEASFWMDSIKGFPKLSSKELSYYIPFVARYLCEQGFSELLTIKTKQPNRV